MRPRLVPAVLLAGLLAGCGDAAPASGPGTTPGTPEASAAQSIPDGGAARVDLAARAALAQDYRFAALYTWDVAGRAPRSVVATVANDGSWRVDIPGGALGGTADVSIAQTTAGVFQCALPSAAHPINPACVRVADPNRRIPDEYDPKIQRVFRQWLPVFTDRQAALSVVPARALAGAQGRCYSIDGISASMRAPVDVGIYCYAENGLLTAARVNFGTLTLAGVPAPAPPGIDLPGPVVGGEPMGMASPPPPPVIEPSTGPSGPA